MKILWRLDEDRITLEPMEKNIGTVYQKQHRNTLSGFTGSDIVCGLGGRIGHCVVEKCATNANVTQDSCP